MLRSSADICCEIAEVVYPRSFAAELSDPCSTTALSARTWVKLTVESADWNRASTHCSFAVRDTPSEYIWSRSNQQYWSDAECGLTELHPG